MDGHRRVPRVGLDGEEVSVGHEGSEMKQAVDGVFASWLFHPTGES